MTDSKDRAGSRISEQELVAALGKAILFPAVNVKGKSGLRRAVDLIISRSH